MRLAYKMNLAVLGLLGLSAAVVGTFFILSYGELKDEAYRWFDASATATARTIGSRAWESIDYFDIPGVDRVLTEALEKDVNLLWVSAAFGEGLREVRAAGEAEKGPFRAFEIGVDPAGKGRAVIKLHYASGVLARRLGDVQSRIAIGSGITLVVLIGVIFLLVNRLVSRPLAHLVESADRTASGDLTTFFKLDSRDEFGQLAESLNRMTEGLREMLGKVRRTFDDLDGATRDITGISHRIAEGATGQTDAVATVSSSIEEMNASIKSVVQSVENLFALAGESSSSMLEMSASVDQVAGNTELLSSGVDQTSSSISQMTVSVRSVSENVGRLADLVASTTSSITEVESVIREVERNSREGYELSREVARTMTEDGLGALQRSADGMREIRDSVAQAATVIRTLEKRSREIGSILNVINEVNDQTNLLALNAAILAAQAGEQGRGFAVVAEEIRELSARTASSTKEVTRLITSVQKESTNAVAAMDEGTTRVESGARHVEDLGETIRRAAENSEKASDASRIIAQSTAEQYKGIRQITTSAQNIAEMSQEIARSMKEQSIGSAQIAKAAEDMRELARQAKKAMAEQSKGVKLTSRASEESARLSQQVLDATREEARGSDLVVKNISAIQEVSNRNAEAVRKLDDLVEVLGREAEVLRGEIGNFKIEKQA